MKRELNFLPHAEVRIEERRISKSLLKKAIFEPDQIIKERNRTIFHKRYINSKNKKEYLL